MMKLAKGIQNWLNPTAKETGIVPVLIDEVEAAPAPRAEEVKDLQTGLVQNILALERKSAEVRRQLTALTLTNMSGARR